MAKTTKSSQLHLNASQLLESSGASSGLTPVEHPFIYDGPPPSYDDSITHSIPNPATTGDAPIIVTQPTSISNDRGSIISFKLSRSVNFLHCILRKVRPNTIFV